MAGKSFEEKKQLLKKALNLMWLNHLREKHKALQQKLAKEKEIKEKAEESEA